MKTSNNSQMVEGNNLHRVAAAPSWFWGLWSFPLSSLTTELISFVWPDYCRISRDSFLLLGKLNRLISIYFSQQIILSSPDRNTRFFGLRVGKEQVTEIPLVCLCHDSKCKVKGEMNSLGITPYHHNLICCVCVVSSNRGWINLIVLTGVITAALSCQSELTMWVQIQICHIWPSGFEFGGRLKFAYWSMRLSDRNC